MLIGMLISEPCCVPELPETCTLVVLLVEWPSSEMALPATVTGAFTLIETGVSDPADDGDADANPVPTSHSPPVNNPT